MLNSTFSLGLGNDGAEIQDFSGTINGGMGRDSISASSNRTITESLIRGQAGDDVFNFTNIASTIVNTNSDDDYIAISGKTISFAPLFLASSVADMIRALFPAQSPTV